MTSEHTEFKDWLDEIITESLGPDWTSRDAATMIIDNLAAEQPAYNATHDLLEAAREAKILIGARNDTLHPTVRESNISMAWHKLNAAIAKAEGRLSRFIIQPKTDPLVEALLEVDGDTSIQTDELYAATLRAALKSRGLEIREVGK